MARNNLFRFQASANGFPWFRTALWLVGAACCLVWTGCGPSYPETAEVRGRVTYQGKPLPEGRILFWPPEGRPAMAEIGPDGSYSLTTFVTGDGAIPGEHRVTIKATRVHFNEAGADIPRRDVAPGGESPSERSTEPVVEWLVPRIYERAESSPLKAAVRPGQNTINFDLPVEP